MKLFEQKLHFDSFDSREEMPLKKIKLSVKTHITFKDVIYVKDYL